MARVMFRAAYVVKAAERAIEAAEKAATEAIERRVIELTREANAVRDGLWPFGATRCRTRAEAEAYLDEPWHECFSETRREQFRLAARNEVAERLLKTARAALAGGAGAIALDASEIAALERHAPAANDNKGRGDFICTFTGLHAYPCDLREEEVSIRDIAHALSMQCRYAGHCRRFYSTAEHSVHVARWVLERTGDPSAALWALLHDAGEAYLVDVPRPVKPELVGYAELEAGIMRVVCRKFGLPEEAPPIVKEADTRILGDEMQQNMPRSYDYAPPLGIKLDFWVPFEAEVMFLHTFDTLEGKINALAA